MKYTSILDKTYNLFTYLALPGIMGHLLIKSIKNSEYHKRYPERFGHVSFGPLSDSIWIHGVSVGEVQSAHPLAKKILEQNICRDMVVTSTTPTGSEQVQNTFPKSIYHSYLPYDLPFFVNRFFPSVNPKLVMFMETEIWPNIFKYCHNSSIPLVIANARISPDSFKRYQKIKFFISPVLNYCQKILAQSEKDAERFLSLGVSPRKIITTGNIKFDIELSENKIEKGRKLREKFAPKGPIWVAASTHNGEEEQLLDVHAKLLEKEPEALLIIVPRHPERFETVADLCSKKGYQFQRHSKRKGVDPDIKVYLGDTMGDLPTYYAASDIAFVGGSLAEIGGHNMLEPSALGLPVFTGPHLFNFQEIANMLQENQALSIVNSSEELFQNLYSLLQHPANIKTISEKAKQVVHDNKGAVEKTLKQITELLPQGTD